MHWRAESPGRDRCQRLPHRGADRLHGPTQLVHLYVGTKQNFGNEGGRAGLANGQVYGVRVWHNGSVVTGEDPNFVFSSAAPPVTPARFELVSLGDFSAKTGAQIQDEAITKQVTQFIRVKDGR